MTPEAANPIEVDPPVLHGQARIRGTRIPVNLVLDCVAASMAETGIMVEYPSLTPDGIRAAAAYGAR